MNAALITSLLAIALLILALVARMMKDGRLSDILGIIGIVLVMVSCSRAGGVA
jgi:hypothetical protein